VEGEYADGRLYASSAAGLSIHASTKQVITQRLQQDGLYAFYRSLNQSRDSAEPKCMHHHTIVGHS